MSSLPARENNNETLSQKKKKDVKWGKRLADLEGAVGVSGKVNMTKYTEYIEECE